MPRHQARLPDALNQIFHEARTHTAWLPKPVPTELLHEMYNLAKLGPTKLPMAPRALLVFTGNPAAKERFDPPALMPGNVDKTRSAPVTAIVAWDAAFYEHFPRLFPHMDMKAMFVGNQPLIEETAMRNGSLQGAYLLIAARSLGLDCGPMSGFDQKKVNAEFFPDGKWKANFLINMGYGDKSKLHPRGPRLSFEEACKVL